MYIYNIILYLYLPFHTLVIQFQTFVMERSANNIYKVFTWHICDATHSRIKRSEMRGLSPNHELASGFLLLVLVISLGCQLTREKLDYLFNFN